MTEKIFVSYAHQDHYLLKDVERELRKHGLVSSKHVVLCDPQTEIKAGDNIREVIKKQIMSANKVVFIASENSTDSQWVNYEVGMASALGKPIVVIGERGMETPSFFSALDNVESIDFEHSSSIDDSQHSNSL